MSPSTYLEWWHRGEWKRIGWTALTAQSIIDLREHGARLAATGGRYRMTQAVIVGPPVVVHTYPVAAAS